MTQSQAGQQHPTVFITFELVGQYDPTTGELDALPGGHPDLLQGDHAEDDRLAARRPQGDRLRPAGPRVPRPRDPGAADLFDREIDVVCEHETYEGQTRERWSIHRERTREKLGREDLARLDAQFGDQIRRVLGAGDTAVAPPPVTEINDDNPF